MKIFDIYKHPTLGYEAVKKGVSWPAFFFTWIWAFIKKLWGIGLIFVAISFVLLAIETVFEQEGDEGAVLVMYLLEIGLSILFGAKGNEWRSKNLQNRGYELIETLEADTPDAAIALAAKSNESGAVNDQ